MGRLAILFLIVLGTAGEALAADASLQIEFLTMNGHTKKFKYPVTRSVARSLEASPVVLQEYLEKARTQYADTLGYSTAKYGRDAWKLVPGLRVRSVKLDDGAGGVLSLRSR